MKTKLTIICLALVAGVAIAVWKSKNPSFESELILANVEALATGENTTNWSELKLAVVECTCEDGKDGFTLQCRKDGSYENCSQTQQGLTGCYKVAPLSPDRIKLCD